MKIGIAIEGLKNVKTGCEYFTYNIIQNMLKIDNKNDYVLLQHERFDTEFDYGNPKIILLKRNSLFKMMRKIASIMPKKIIHFTVIKYISQKIFNQLSAHTKKIESLDILFVPSQHSTQLAENEFKYRVVCIYDITPMLFPELHRSSTVLYYGTILKNMLNKSDCVVTISESTKKDIIRHMQIAENKIKIIYPGLNPHIHKIQDYNAALEKYNISGEFILYLGTLEPRKNIPVLLEAFSLLKKDGFNEKLVLAGRKGWLFDEIFKTIKRLHLEKDVIFTDYVEEKYVSQLYSAAKLFVYPSLYEGFGMPILEAMACGCPVITSNTSSLPEAGGNAVLYFDPKNPKNIFEQMKKALLSEKLRKDMIKKGVMHASQFSWEKSAREIINIFNEIYKSDSK